MWWGRTYLNWLSRGLLVERLVWTLFHIQQSVVCAAAPSSIDTAFQSPSSAASNHTSFSTNISMEHVSSLSPALISNGLFTILMLNCIFCKSKRGTIAYSWNQKGHRLFKTASDLFIGEANSASFRLLAEKLAFNMKFIFIWNWTFFFFLNWRICS